MDDRFHSGVPRAQGHRTGQEPGAVRPQAVSQDERGELTGMEIDGLLARRDKIVKFFEDEVAKKGEGAVLFDLPRVGQPCGEGL